jgi:ubiquinone/menaquinone biosynthesis C-methylase UbiE
MLEIDKFLAASSKNLEGLSLYEIASKLGLLSFNTQGNRPIEQTTKLAQITSSSIVLLVGCGAGGIAVHLAETAGAEVHGIDISPESIRTANTLASKSAANQKLHFQIGDAHALSFRPNTFDVVITEFMAFFLKQSAFKGFLSALKPGGQIVLLELVKDPKVNARADTKILAAEQTYSALIGYRFHIPLVTDYIERLTKAGLEHVHLTERFSEQSLHERIKNVGGWKNLFKITKVTLKLMLASPELRKKFIQVGLIKRVLYQNQPTAKYIFQAILTGQKHNNSHWTHS